MAVHFSGDLSALKMGFAGQVLVAGDAGYDEARSVWNGAIDRRPQVIARCATTEDVARAVAFGRDSGLEIAVRGGGHNYSGNAVCDGGLMIHLGAMNSVSVDPAARKVLAGGGATWGELDAATQAPLPRWSLWASSGTRGSYMR